MKKAICILLAILTLASCACSGARIVVPADEGVFDLFMNAVKNKQYREAYSFVSARVAPTNSESGEITPASHTASYKEFENYYSRVASIFRVTDFSYEKISEETVNASRRNVDYRVNYNFEEAGQMSFDCTMSLIVEEGVWRVLWSPSLILPDLSWNEEIGRAVQTAKRGDILTKDGTVVAQTINLVTVYCILSEIVDYDVIRERIAENEGMTPDEASQVLTDRLAKRETLNLYCAQELQQLYNEVSACIEFAEDETPDKIFKSAVNDFIVIKQFRPEEITTEQLQELDSIDGVHIDTKNYGAARVYPYGDFLAHNLGYVGAPTEEEVASLNEGRSVADGLYTTDSVIGKTGVERRYETELRGYDGFYYFIRNTDGSIKKILYRKEKQDGIDVMLTVDFDLQQRTQELLDIVLYGYNTSGAVIVMNPKTGEVEAMASYPTYDLNKFVTGFTEEEYQELSEQPNIPFLDRTKRGLYPPGSTFKVFTAAAALDTGTMTANYEFTGRIDNDYWTPTGYGTWIWPRIKRTRVVNRLLPLNMTNCMLHSDNIYFANAALMIGAEKFVTYLDNFGMDQALPFELSVARSQVIGNMADMNYKMLADTGYGQGQVLVTPLQLATMYCALCNGGDLPTPRITSGFYRTNGIKYECVESTEYKTWIENAVSDQTINTLIPMLQAVVDPTGRGTGRSLRVTNVDVAGKTGSAEIGGDKTRIISWFAGFRLNVDVEDERVVVVMLDVPDVSPYTTLKFQIARELLKLAEPFDPNEQ
ncbi:MAG: hypothetical protein IK064_05580 [Clostridia bacterium]|nr:hypothetical protein [Clostridia bacterium]